jgi:hypothetical protein
MRTTFLALAATGLAALAVPRAADAQLYTNYAFCAQYDLDTISCAFDTFAQCLANISGRGGSCYANSEYRPAAARTRKKARRG